MTARDRVLILVLACIGLAAGFWFVGIAPKREDSKRLGADVQAAEKRLEVALAKVTKVESSRAKYRSDYATVARLGKAVPQDGDVASLVYQLESAARRAKVDVKAIHLEGGQAEAPAAPEAAAGAPAASGGLTPVPFSFTFEGTYTSLQRLLKAVRGQVRVNGSNIAVIGRLLTVDAVDLTAAESGLPQVKAEIKARAFTASLPGAPPAPATAGGSAQNAAPAPEAGSSTPAPAGPTAQVTP